MREPHAVFNRREDREWSKAGDFAKEVRTYEGDLHVAIGGARKVADFPLPDAQLA